MCRWLELMVRVWGLSDWRGKTEACCECGRGWCCVKSGGGRPALAARRSLAPLPRGNSVIVQHVHTNGLAVLVACRVNAPAVELGLRCIGVASRLGGGALSLEATLLLLLLLLLRRRRWRRLRQLRLR